MAPTRLLTALAMAALLAVVPVASAPAATGPRGPVIPAGHGAHRAGLPVTAGPRSRSPFQNWAGWADVAHAHVQLYSVAAQFRVPAVTCPGPTYEVDFWVGLDGWANKTVEQTGVDATCDIPLPSGGYAPTYTDWYEMFPSPPVTRHDVSPGDIIDASVSYDSGNGRYYLEIVDKRHPSASFSKPLPCPRGHTCGKSSAEVIVEDPGTGPPGGVYLARYGSVRFSDIEVISRRGTVGTLAGNSQWSTDETVMKYRRTVMSQPSRRADRNTAFSVSFRSSG